MYWAYIARLNVNETTHRKSHSIIFGFLFTVYLFSASYPSAIYSESIKPLSVLHPGLKRDWQPILTPQKNQKTMLLNLFYATLQY